MYVNSLPGAFVDDDAWQVLRNPWIRDARFIPEMFSGGVWKFLGRRSESNYYRPFMHLFYLAAYQIFGLRAWGFHLVSVLLHAANTLLVFGLAARLAGSAPGAFLSVPFVAALLFATHPIHTEAVAWIASVPDLALTFFYLGAFHLYVAAEGRLGGRLLVSAALFLCALLSKETALSLPLLLVIYEASGRPHRSAAERGLAFVPYLAAIAAYLALRDRAMSGVLLPTPESHGLSPYQLAINALPLFVDYVRLVMVPAPLNFWHEFRPIDGLLGFRGGLSLAVCLGFAIAARAAWRKHPLLLLCAGLFVVPLLPALHVAAIQTRPLGERYLYLPSVGFVLGMAVLLCRAARAERMRRMVVLAVVALVASYAGATVMRNRVWRDPQALYADTVRKSPGALGPRANLATALLERGDLEAAREQYETLLRAYPDEGLALAGMGSVRLAEGAPEEAIEYLKSGLSRAPGLVGAYNNLAIALQQTGQPDEALAALRMALDLEPEFPDAHFTLAGVLAELGEGRRALEHYRAAVRVRPDNAYYRAALGIECAKQGRLDEAIAQFRESVRLDPSQPAYRHNLERALTLARPAPAPGEGAR